MRSGAIDSITAMKMATSFEFDGFYVPANSLVPYVARYTQPALFYNRDYPEYRFSSRGTSTKIRFRDRYFLAICSHQVQGFEDDQVGILESGRFLTASLVVSSNCMKFGESTFDLRIYDYSDYVERGELSSSGWFELNEEPGGIEDNDLYAAIGHPQSKISIDWADMKILSYWTWVQGESSKSHIKHRKCITVNSPLLTGFDGFSGGPVLRIFIKGFTPSLHFAGITTNASRNRLHFLSQEQIRLFAKELID